MFLPKNPYAVTPVRFSVKKEKQSSLLERERATELDTGLASFQRRAAVQEVSRALNAWNYQERLSA